MYGGGLVDEVGCAELVCLYVGLCEGDCECVFAGGVWFVGGCVGRGGSCDEGKRGRDNEVNGRVVCKVCRGGPMV
jgi:hypothetical protein